MLRSANIIGKLKIANYKIVGLKIPTYKFEVYKNLWERPKIVLKQLTFPKKLSLNNSVDICFVCVL